MVAAGDVRYYIEGGDMGGMAGPARLDQQAKQNPQLAEAVEQGGNGPGGGESDTESSTIDEWVKANFTATTVGGFTVYDLAAPSA